MDLTDLVALIQQGGEGASKFKKASTAEEVIKLAEQAIGGKVDVAQLIKLVRKSGVLQNIDFGSLADKLDRDGDGLDMDDITAAASTLMGGGALAGDGKKAETKAAAAKKKVTEEAEAAGVDMGDVAKVAGAVIAGVAAGQALGKAAKAKMDKAADDDEADAKATKAAAMEGVDLTDGIDLGDVMKLAGNLMGDK